MRYGSLYAVGAVVLVLVALFGAYWALSAPRPAPAAAPQPLVSYYQSGAFTYVAALEPNSLYNTTTLTQGNGTLFTAITTWVNLTFAYRLISSEPVNASSAVVLGIVLQSPAWSKVLGEVGAQQVVRAGTSETLSVAVDLNVTNVTGLAATIEKETNYFPSSYEVLLSPSVTTSLSYRGTSTGFGFDPSVTLNFTANQIVPSRLTSGAPGVLLPPTLPTTSSASPVGPIPYILLLCASAGAAVLGILAYRAGAGRRVPDLDALTRPFQEAIVDTPTGPPLLRRVTVRAWEDLVKVADTLGCPILRVVGPAGHPPGEDGTQFYVLSGTMAYVYLHQGSAPPGGLPPAPSARPTRPVDPRPGPAPAIPPLAPPVSAGPNQPARWDLGAFVARAEQIRDSVRSTPPAAVSYSTGAESPEELLRRAIGLARRGQLPAAWVVLERLRAEVGPGDPPSGFSRSGGAAVRPHGPPR